MTEGDVMVRMRGVGKDYSLETRPLRRLCDRLLNRRPSGAVYRALQPLDLTVRRGESIGVIGRNGAGKSTLLQLLCGVLEPSSGTLEVRGRVAALLELGAGFNPELTGRENVRLNGPLLGLSAAEIERRLPEIVAFADIGHFIDQPVRSYSSGMFVRLAFSMATSVEPDILVIDEALSVGDGAFARKSFERIIELKERGATLLFCSHSLFQVEAMCSRALWLNDGVVQFDGPAHQAVVKYSAWMGAAEVSSAGSLPEPVRFDTASATLLDVRVVGSGSALRSGVDDLEIQVHFRSDPQIPAPTVGVTLQAGDGRTITSAASWIDGIAVRRDAQGEARVSLVLPSLPLLKGEYFVSAYVLCERGINVYSSAEQTCRFEVSQAGLLQGIVRLPFEWRQGPTDG